VRRPLVLVVVAALLAGCTGTPSMPEPVSLRVLMADDWASAPIVGEVVDEFERATGVDVQLQSAPFSQIPDLARSGVELGQPHDVVHWHAFAAAAAGLAQPVDDLWAEAGLTAEEYVPGALEDVTWDSRRYGVPLDINALVLMVNAASFEQAGLELDDVATLEGFEQAAEQVVDSGASQYAITVSASSWAAYGWIVANGGQLLARDADGEVVFTLDDPANVAALEQLAELVATERAPGPFAQNLALEAIESFADGSTAMHASGSWDLPIAQRAAQAEFTPEDIRILPLPQHDPARPRTVLGGSSLFIPPDAPHREVAFELMMALTQDDIALRLAVDEGRLPARQRVYEEPIFASSPDLAAFVALLPTAEVMPLVAYPPVAAAFREALEDAVAQREPVAEALEGAQRYAERWLAEGGGAR
jgi:multiple sugar transport system substrate-binding protein